MELSETDKIDDIIEPSSFGWIVCCCYLFAILKRWNF